MGTACCHEIPLLFLNLKNGERLNLHINIIVLQSLYHAPSLYRIDYAVYVVKELKKLFPQHKPQLFYDISCTLYSHMKVAVSLDQCMHYVIM